MGAVHDDLDSTVWYNNQLGRPVAALAGVKKLFSKLGLRAGWRLPKSGVSQRAWASGVWLKL